MNLLMGLALILSACCAALGQILLKLGAEGRANPLALFNWHILLGLGVYGVGLGLWLYALTRLPLSAVYPFATLTLVLVTVLSALMLGDRPSAVVCAGYFLVAAGLGVMWFGASIAPR